MTTLSQLVDDLVRETRRSDMLRDITDYANQTIRELHFDPANNAAVFYRENFFEARITAMSDSSLTWPIPDPGTFQAIQVAQYGASGNYVSERTPSRALAGLSEYFYRTGSTYVFSGFGAYGSVVNLGWFQFPRRLLYYAVGQRPAEYFADTGWDYATEFDNSDAERTAAEVFTSNWLLTRWRDTVAEGIRAKIYKRISDTDRARTSYSMYTAMRAQLVSSESADIGGFS